MRLADTCLDPAVFSGCDGIKTWIQVLCSVLPMKQRGPASGTGWGTAGLRGFQLGAGP